MLGTRTDGTCKWSLAFDGLSMIRFGGIVALDARAGRGRHPRGTDPRRERRGGSPEDRLVSRCGNWNGANTTPTARCRLRPSLDRSPAGRRLVGLSRTAPHARAARGAAAHGRPRAHDGRLPRGPSEPDAPARATCDVVVVSLFVNPAQFGAGEDLERYPRDEAATPRSPRREGVDVLFAPPVGEVYPEGFATTVEVPGLADVLCGAPAQPRPRPLPRRRDRGRKALQHVHARTSPTSARRTSSRRS